MKVDANHSIKSYLQLQAAQAGSALRLQTGQVLEGQVLTRLSETMVELKLGQHLVKAKSELPLKTGEKIQLEVVRGGDKPILKLKSQTAAQLLAHSGLKQILPRQGSLTTLMANLFPAASIQSKLPPQIINAVQDLLNQLPTKSEISTAQGLKQAIKDSGILFEARMANAPAAANKADLKGMLLKVLMSAKNFGPNASSNAPPASAATTAMSVQHAKTLVQNLFSLLGQPARHTSVAAGSTSGYRSLNPSSSQSGTPLSSVTTAPKSPSAAALFAPMKTSPMQAQAAATPNLSRLPTLDQPQELSRQIEQSLARIQTQQLTHVEQQGQFLQTEIPVKNGEHIDLFQLRLQQDEHVSEQEITRPWSVTLAFEMENTGPVYARVAVQGDGISTSFWAANAHTLAQLEREIASLETKLETQGLHLSKLQTYLGLPPWQQGGQDPHLVDDQV